MHQHSEGVKPQREDRQTGKPFIKIEIKIFPVFLRATYRQRVVNK